MFSRHESPDIKIREKLSSKHGNDFRSWESTIFFFRLNVMKTILTIHQFITPRNLFLFPIWLNFPLQTNREKIKFFHKFYLIFFFVSRYTISYHGNRFPHTQNLFKKNQMKIKINIQNKQKWSMKINPIFCVCSVLGIFIS